MPDSTRYEAPQRVYPGGYVRCDSTLSGENFMHGKWRERCLMPKGHDGLHWNGNDRSYRQWSDDDADA